MFSTTCVPCTATGNPNCKLQAVSGGGYSGGGGASTGAAKDASTGAKYFYKSTGMWGLDMLMAEYKGIKVHVCGLLLAGDGRRSGGKARV